MATLYKHGRELLCVERLADKIAYMEDGKVLRNAGNGWKIWKRVKPGVKVSEVVEQRRLRSEQWEAARPSYCTFRRALHQFTSLEKRFLVLEALKMLSGDLDGLWSELNDHAGLGCSLDDVRGLVTEYEAFQIECKELSDPTNAIAQA